MWSEYVSYGEIRYEEERQHSVYNLELGDIEMLRKLFEMYETEAYRIIDEGLVLPGYDYILKCSQTFNLLDARGAVSVTERAGFIEKIRKMACKVARAYVEHREEIGHPLLKTVDA